MSTRRWAAKRLRRGARLWSVATSTFKAETYRFLRQDRPAEEEIAAGAPFPPGTVHLPSWADSEWLKQLTAEQLVTVKGKRGFAKLEWQKLRERNEALDCRVYARAAAWIAGADRWSEARWADWKRQLGVEKQTEADDDARSEPAPRKRPAPADGALELHEVTHGHGRRAPRPPRGARSRSGPPAWRGSAMTARPWSIAAWPRSTGPSRRWIARSRRPRGGGSCGRCA